jgi:membrane-bound lytic murein transglycosylase D
VPQFVAITYTMNYLDEHNFYNEGEEMLVTSDTLHVKNYLHFETFANLTNACLEDLQRLNPSIQHNALPQSNKHYILYVPKESKDLLALNRLAILDSASKVGRNELQVLAKKSEGSIYGRDRMVYKVRSGDVLGSIAMRHGVRVNDLKKWNNMRSNTIRVGQRLNIWLRQSAASSTSVVASAKTNSNPIPVPNSKTYTVQPGDTLWNISRKFEGLTIEKIKSLNKLDNTKLQPGQKLIIGI